MREQFEVRVRNILKNVKAASDFYIWGTGGVANKFFKILKEYQIEPTGFIVSDGYRTEKIFCAKNVYEFSEIKDKLKYSCVYIAVHDVKNVLENKKEILSGNIKILDDTKDLCSLYALRAIKYFEMKGINIDEKYLEIDQFTFLNPFHTDWNYCLAWLVEYGDLICPAMFGEFGLIDEGPYEVDQVKIETNDIVIDGGANIGLFTAYAVYKGAKKVYAFEPVPKVQEYLRETCSVYGSSIDVEPYALSASCGIVDFYVQNENLTSGSIGEIRQNEKDFILKVKKVTIDHWVKENNIDKVDFIKADIEGAERDMLTGAKETIKRFLPKIAICTYHLEDDPYVLESIIRDCSSKYVIEHHWKKIYAYVPKNKIKE